MNLPSIPADKLGHFFWGCVIATCASALAILLGKPLLDAALLGLSCAAAAGLLKEGVDALGNRRATGDWLAGPHGVDPIDAVATAAGGVPALLLAYIHLAT